LACGLRRLAPRQNIASPRRLLCTPAATPPPPPPPPPAAEPGVVGHIMKQIGSECATFTESQGKFFGFCGACCNWFLGLSAVYDASNKGPEVISLPMTCVMLCYSSLFGRWAGWAVMPRNYILAGSHIFNVVAQTNQLRRCLEHKLATGGEAAKAEVRMRTVLALALSLWQPYPYPHPNPYP